MTSTDEKMVSFISYEALGARLERTIKRLWVTNIFLISALAITNLLWLIVRR